MMLNLESDLGTNPHAGVLTNNSPAEGSESECRQSNRWLMPYQGPSDVIRNPHLSVSEKKAILSSWASDACAVESHPALRKPPGLMAPVLYREIMDALLLLDRPEAA
jgi:hypothetical protein